MFFGAAPGRYAKFIFIILRAYYFRKGAIGMEIEITSANFENEVTLSAKPVLLDFTAGWCEEAKKIQPAVKEIAKEHPEITVGKIDVDRSPEIAERFGVMNVPSFLLFRDGRLSVFSTGNQTKETIADILSERGDI